MSSREEIIAAYDLAFPLTSAPGMRVVKEESREEIIAEYDLTYPPTPEWRLTRGPRRLPRKISVPEEIEGTQKRAA